MPAAAGVTYMIEERRERIQAIMAQNDIGIDLGTTTIIIAQEGKGVVLNQPSVVAMDTRKNTVLEAGDKALAMVGRTPNYISAIFPLKDGVISDHTMTRELICRFVNQVDVVETEVLDTHLLHEFEAGIDLVAGTLHGRCTLVPGEFLGAAAELVAAFGAEGVPPRHRETEPILHLAAAYDALGVIVMECERILRILALEGDFPYGGEILFG